MKIRRFVAGSMLASTLALGTLTTGGCKNAQQAEAGVFTTEQVVCMVMGLVSGSLSGTSQQIAQVIEQACPTILPALTQDVINFINAFQALSPAQKEIWKKYAAEHAAPDAR